MDPPKPYNNGLQLCYILEVFGVILTADVWAYVLSNFELFVVLVGESQNPIYGSLELDITWH